MGEKFLHIFFGLILLSPYYFIPDSLCNGKSWDVCPAIQEESLSFIVGMFLWSATLIYIAMHLKADKE
jgi:hypothetical protein